MSVQSLPYEAFYKRRSRRISFFIHALILLILIFFTLPFDKNKNIDTQYAVTIAFQSSVSSNSAPTKASAGAQRPVTRETAKEVEKITNKPAQKIENQPKTAPVIKPSNSPKPSEPIVAVIIQEESEIVAVEEDILFDDPEPEIVPDPEPVHIPTSEPGTSSSQTPSLEEVLEEIEEEATVTEGGIPTDNEETTLEEARVPPARNKSGQAGTGTGKEGTGNADGKKGNDTDDGIGTKPAGEGEYDDSGIGIFGRKVIFRNPDMIKNASGKSGKISFKVCINRKGTVKYVELNELVTTVKDKTMIKEAMNAMWDYRYEPDLSAPWEECGKFTVIIDNFQGIRPNN